MITDISNNWSALKREIKGRAELYSGAALAAIYSPDDALINWKIERVSEGGKFFGFGICQKLTINLIDRERQINIDNTNSFKVYLSSGGYFITSAPTFYVDDVQRDENTNDLTITAHDAIYKASEHTFAELGLQAPYTVKDVLNACALLLGLDGFMQTGTGRDELWQSYSYEEGANYEGTETIREVLDDIAEATQTIYYVNNNKRIVIKRLDMAGEAVLNIDKSVYSELSSKGMHTLAAIVSSTELGDNVGTTTDIDGFTQYVHENAFYAAAEDIAAVLNDAISYVGGMTIAEYNCNWRGNFALEIGDKIAITAKDNSKFSSYILYSTLEYNGGFSAIDSWEFVEGDAAHANPSSIGEVLKQTYAKVDKVKKEVEIVVDETTQLKLDSASISASVSNLTTEVSTKMSTKDVTIAIQNELVNGAHKVVTATGFKFDDDGLTVSKTDSEINTTISEDGMIIYKKNKEVLRADNEGVKATDLHATTYMIIGKNSRFEDFKNNRTACIWIG